MTDLDRATLLDQLLRYVKDELAGGVDPELITADSQLLELGVLDSVRTARLLAHIRSEYGTRIPPLYMTGEHFRTLETITDLILLLRSQTASI
ncbi:acyl carrier protein [Streptomyces sp. SL13]|uniref:Acyl carrier protein n=1 Tax=Streptantibioticus silvisoli TaxID=2705255 RepID=A0AA90KF53_9ACTN|nr:acyl carrier protein [Streptantibioticus silvisoli]MDI5963287.1 acyl carrier protein [Streptantibioticus silvisoli]MDI5968534.1 acyl carrier protein [Streptantibioticus silvisoli]